MKAALEAWRADSNLFQQGAAKERTDPDVIAVTMKKPGVVLKRRKSRRCLTGLPDRHGDAKYGLTQT
jgi:hypothetical protein